ncbi:uncharacterized protein LOC110052977 [Orbicella faveolata]|uniref:uncharacterized protein LOC110052977 n=1 Tax=Orbicella faveolata TaxID=48498 RepID=UPI0009E27A9A|nr:uncharacterized protein LOC110052977 [Orbicella faveolata]
MGTLHVPICRWMLATFVVFGALRQSKSFNFTSKPADPTVVVEGVNSTQVHLVWNFTATTGFGIIITREKSDGTQNIQIATLGLGSAAFVISNQVAAEYEAIPPGTLVIKEVTRNDECVYSFAVLNSFLHRELFDSVAIDVLCEYIKQLWMCSFIPGLFHCLP